MSRLFFPKLALSNLVKNRKTYVPYLLSCVGTVMMFYIMVTLAKNEVLASLHGGDTLRVCLTLGYNVVALFAMIFLFYTYSFLVKRRKKEFGLLNILGMEKKHISIMMLFETVYVGIISCAAGVAGGTLLSKLMQLLLLKIMHVEVQFGFDLSMQAVLYTLILFGLIFLLSFLNTLRQIHLVSPIDLLKGGQVGEREPKSRWLITLLGVACIGIAYYIALTTESPLKAMNSFFIAVILVIIGTQALFISGSIALLKLLRGNKKFYYQTRHFTSVSGMLYRMKQNAVGLANICILSTAVLVMISTTLSLYIGMDDVIRTRFARNLLIDGRPTLQQIEQMDVIIGEACERLAVTPENVIRYRSKNLHVVPSGNRLIVPEDSDAEFVTDGWGVLTMLPLAEYNRMFHENQTLEPGEVLLSYEKGQLDESLPLEIHGKNYRIKERLSELNLLIGQRDPFYLILPTEADIAEIYEAVLDKPMDELLFNYGFDVTGNAELQTTLYETITRRIEEQQMPIYVECAEASRAGFYVLYGGLFFLGIFLGLLFIMATVLIIYYKQISEGYDDKERFEIMQKVGMSHREVRRSINSQVLTVFFLPLVAACMHIAVAFKIITKLLAMLNLTNVPLFAACTVGTILVFALFYVAVYALTAKTYYKIVS